MLAFVGFHATEVEDFVSVSMAVKLFREEERRIEHLAVQAVEFLDSVCHDLGIGEQPSRFSESISVGFPNACPQGLVLEIVRAIPVWSVPKVVEAAQVMNEPDDLVRMRDQVRGRPQGDDSVGRLREIEEAVGHKLGQYFIEGFDEGQIDYLDLVTVLAQLDRQPIDDEAPASLNKRNAA